MIVGKMVNSMKSSTKVMPRVPRSSTRESPPVCRSRWKRSDSACRCWNTRSAMRRAARACTFTNTASRSSENQLELTRSSP